MGAVIAVDGATVDVAVVAVLVAGSLAAETDHTKDDVALELEARSKSQESDGSAARDRLLLLA